MPGTQYNFLLQRVSRKDIQKSIWSAVDYSQMGGSLQCVAESLADTLRLQSNQKVLDVAAGHGNFTIAAAKRRTHTVSTDFIPRALNQGRSRLKALSLSADFDLADAECLPFAAESFDITASTFGVMFTLQADIAAQELLRVTRGNGKIGLTNWQTNSFIGRILSTIGTYAPHAVSLESLKIWGTHAKLEALFKHSSSKIEIKCRHHLFQYRSAQHWLSLFHRYYGPLHYAFSTLDNATVALLVRDLLKITEEFNIGTGSAIVIPAHYLECLVIKTN